MFTRKNIFAIIGSASRNSSNLKIVRHLEAATQTHFNWTVFDDLHKLPHFDPERTDMNVPPEIEAFRTAIQQSDAVLICTPEYIFSIPSGLKNALEWCVSTLVFSEKPVALITASANGLKGHEELQLILRTLGAVFTEATTLLIQGVKGKVDAEGNITHTGTEKELTDFMEAFRERFPPVP
jgi:NAD(P)H-dependent FMN reductase